MIAEAKALAALGQVAFPVAGGGRTPCVRQGCHDWLTHTATVVGLRWANPTANVSVAIGTASGVFVPDLCVEGAQGIAALPALVAEHVSWPRSRCTNTPSGGRHLWFHQPPRRLRNCANLLPGLDMRDAKGPELGLIGGAA